MAFRILLDANILLDFTLKRPGYDVSRRLMEWVVKGRVQAFVTPAIMQTMQMWLREAYGEEKAKTLLLALLSEVRVIDTGHEVVVSALHSTMGGLEAAIPYYAALHHKLDYFVSRDVMLKKAATRVLPVVTPEEILEQG